MEKAALNNHYKFIKKRPLRQIFEQYGYRVKIKRAGKSFV